MKQKFYEEFVQPVDKQVFATQLIGCGEHALFFCKAKFAFLLLFLF